MGRPSFAMSTFVSLPRSVGLVVRRGLISRGNTSCLVRKCGLGLLELITRLRVGAVSEFERALIRLRLQRGRALKAERGGFAYGSPPFGYGAEGGELKPVAREQEAIRYAKETSEIRHESS